MKDTSGFFKNESGNLLFAPESVGSLTFSLYRNLKETYEYPVEGWSWFDSEEEARDFFELPINTINPDEL